MYNIDKIRQIVRKGKSIRLTIALLILYYPTLFTFISERRDGKRETKKKTQNVFIIRGSLSYFYNAELTT